ncbi:MAG: class I tRNA ligase family protein, partial [Candidatus Marinimicrobia bacterium]|nr:class I tRNA ligase family protein [Candidatus Neomarinimicrobiota bacterium]
AVRFGIMLMAPQGLDVLFSNERLEVGRNFMNKLWNASRFVMMNLTDEQYLDIDLCKEKLELPEKWILSRLQKAIKDVNRQLDRFHFNEAAKVIYEFVWSDYCDWYIEIAKTRFNGNDTQSANTSRAISVHVLKSILALLHPYAPFITEELWDHFKNDNDKDLIVSEWPKIDNKWINRNTENKMILLQELISAVRTIRSSMNVPPSRKANMIVRTNASEEKILQEHETIIKYLCKINTVSYDKNAAKPSQSAVAVVKDLEIFIPLGGLIDFRLEEERLLKRKTELVGILSKIRNKINNQDFLIRAPENVVQREREKLDEISNELEKVKINLEMMK